MSGGSIPKAVVLFQVYLQVVQIHRVLGEIAAQAVEYLREIIEPFIFYEIILIEHI